MENNSNNNPASEVQNNVAVQFVTKNRGTGFWFLMIFFIIPFAMTLIAVPIGMLFGENNNGGPLGSSGTIGSGVVAEGVADAELSEEMYDRTTSDDTRDSSEVSEGGQEISTTGGANRAPGDTTFTGDVLQLFGLEWEDAWWALGEGSVVRIAFTGGYERIYWRYGDDLGGQTFEAVIIGASQRNLTREDIYNEIIGVEALIQITPHQITTGIRQINNINIDKAGGASFGGVYVGDTLLDAEQQLTNISDRITGGVVGYISKLDGAGTSISFGAFASFIFSTNDDVIQHLSDVKERTIDWSVEIDGIIYNVSLSTLDNTTIDSISIEMLLAEDIEMGMPDPFRTPLYELLYDYANAAIATPFGLEGLDPQFWR